jgi:hypothetical protein
VGKLTVKTGSTSRLEHVFILDSTSTTGAGKTGLTNASVTMHFFRPADTTVTSVTLSAGTLGTWTTGGFKEVNATDMPGVYEIGMPNAVFAATFNHSVVMIKGTGIAPVVLEYNLVSYDPLDTVRLGLTAIPNIAQGTTGAISTGNATGQVTVATNNDKTGYSLTTAPLNTAQTASAVWDALLASYTTANSFGARIVRTRSTSPSNEVTITGSFHIAADVHEMQAGVIVAADFAAGAINANALATDAVNEIADCVLSRKLNMAGNIADVSVTSVSSATFTGNNTYIATDTVQFLTTAPTSFALATKYYVIATSLTATTFQLSATSGGSAITTVSTGAFTVVPIDDRTVRSAFRYIRNKVSISSSTMTITTEDDATAAWTATLISTPGLDPVTSSDPS